MSKIFVVSDTHFSHKNICKFIKEDGDKLRPWDDVGEMDKDLIRFWNETVDNNDVVYHIGDVCLSRRGLSVVRELNGIKILIKGNHDNFELGYYTKYFTDVMGCQIIEDAVLTHIPIHSGQLEDWPKANYNIHGHLHHKFVLDEKGKRDKRYFNACLENINFRPIDIDKVFSILRDK